VAVTGAGGQLGRQLVSVLSGADVELLALSRTELDITDPGSLEALRAWNPRVVINAAAWTDVDGCARDPRRAMAVNGTAAGELAGAAAATGALSVQVSTNEVFDGSAERSYRETDAPHPINPYGESKLAGEELVAAANADHLIVRTAWIFGPGGRNFPSRITEVAQRQAAEGRPLRVVDDEFGNPTWAPDLARGIWRAVQLRLAGGSRIPVLHIAGEPPVSRHRWAQQIVESMPDVTLQAISSDEYPRPAPVPRRAVLSTELAESIGIPASDWEAATIEYIASLHAGVAES
jgi:dTDP-4-dehydrorhamnose reductase